MDDIPRRFMARASSLIMKQIGLDHDCYGVFFPETGTFIIESEERGIDDFTGMPPEDVEWIDLEYKRYTRHEQRIAGEPG
jgi:hypothetical protein